MGRALTETNIALELMSFLVLVVVLCGLAGTAERRQHSRRLFIALVVLSMVALACDILAWTLDGRPAWRATFHVVLVVYCIVNALPTACFNLYVDYLVHRDVRGNRRLALFLDDSALAHETVLVSAGRRGLEIELAPADLLALTGGRAAGIAQ